MAEGHNVGLYDPATGQSRTTLGGHTDEDAWAVRWSPDGRRLALGYTDGTLRLWDPASGQRLLIRTAHEGWVTCLAWSPDSQQVASGGGDQLIKVWDAATGDDVLRLAGHTANLASLAWSPDGRRIASGGLDGMVKIWCAATGASSCRSSRRSPSPIWPGARMVDAWRSPLRHAECRFLTRPRAMPTPKGRA